MAEQEAKCSYLVEQGIAKIKTMVETEEVLN